MPENTACQTNHPPLRLVPSPAGPATLSVATTTTFPTELLEAIAERVAEMLDGSTLGSSWAGSPYLTVTEAAEYIRARRQRVDDLLSQRRLTRVKDGRRTLILREELDRYLAGEKTGRFALPADTRRRSGAPRHHAA